jgi:hypothetical protein
VSIAHLVAGNLQPSWGFWTRWDFCLRSLSAAEGVQERETQACAASLSGKRVRQIRCLPQHFDTPGDFLGGQVFREPRVIKPSWQASQIRSRKT